MINLNLKLNVTAFFFTLINAFVLASDKPTIRFVTGLDFVEANQGHLFHDAHLWVARSSFSSETKNRVQIYSADGSTLVETVTLPHSPSYIYPFSENETIIVGKSSWPWKTHYTVVRRTANTFESVTTTLPEDFQIDEFAGTKDNMYTADVGEAKILQVQSPLPRALAPDISGPGKMVLVDNALFVIERRNFEMGDENLVKIDLKTEKADRTFKDYYRQGLTNLRHLPSMGQVALAETKANQVLLVDVATNSLTRTISVEEPRGLAQLGHCLIVSSDDARKIHFFDLSSTESPKIDEWDLSVVGNKLRKAQSLEVDPKTGSVFVRSTYVCHPSLCVEPMGSVVMAEQASKEVYSKCTK